MKLSLLALATLAVAMTVGLSACSKKEVSFETLETARQQAGENAQFNARAWRGQNPATARLGIMSRGDSTQGPSCPQGDGWATIDLVDADTGVKQASLKCSTVSASVGCREANDFKGSPFASDDGNCQVVSKVPFPIPKIVK